MGQDYLARKTAKKRNKKAAREGQAADFTKRSEVGTSRERPNRTTPKKRLGVCFGQPVLTQADKIASDDEAELDPSVFDVLAGAGIRAASFWPLYYLERAKHMPDLLSGCKECSHRVDRPTLAWSSKEVRTRFRFTSLTTWSLQAMVQTPSAKRV
jgi:hypothetical protein